MSTPWATPSPPEPIGSELWRLWQFDPTYDFLNHGSFGAVPRAVAAALTSAQQRIEARPIEMLGRRWRELLAPSRRRVGEFLGMAPGSFGFVSNATEGVNTVLRSITLQPGDELVTTSHVYNAVRNAMRSRARESGASYVEVPIPLPVHGDEAVLSALGSSITGRTRLVVLDQVTSPTALVMPVHQVARLCRERGVELLVDGAHAPGMLDFSVEALGCDYWTGNLHKWCCAPKGTAVLWASDRCRRGVAPMSVSHFSGEGFDAEFDWQGTRDLAPWMVAGMAIDFMGEFGWELVRGHNHRMACWVQRMLCERWELEPVSPDDGRMLGSMCTVPLPAEIRARHGSFAEFQERLYRSHRIEVPVIEFGGRWHVRPSAQVYNAASQYDRLAHAVLELASEA